MKLDYFTLISKEPLNLNIGHLKSPLLREIAQIGIHTYHSFLNVLLLDKDSYFETIEKNTELYFCGYSPKEKEFVYNIKEEYMSLTEDEKIKIPLLHLLSFDKRMIASIEQALSFFFEESIRFNETKSCFQLLEKEKVIGEFSFYHYDEIADFILQRCHVNKNVEKEDESKAKNKTALAILKKLKKGQKELDKLKKSDEKMELGNIISSVAAKNNCGLNIENIWDITIFQLYDQFQRFQINDSYNIQSMSISAWGDKENRFDSTMWFKNIYEN